MIPHELMCFQNLSSTLFVQMFTCVFRMSAFNFRMSTSDFRTAIFNFRMYPFCFRTATFNFSISAYNFKMSTSSFRTAIFDFIISTSCKLWLFMKVTLLYFHPVRCLYRYCCRLLVHFARFSSVRQRYNPSTLPYCPRTVSCRCCRSR